MANPTQFVREHWKPLAAGFVGLLVLYYLAKRGAAQSGNASQPGAASSPAQLAGYSAAADLQNAQVNGQVEIAQLNAMVQAHAVDAGAAVQIAQINAQLDATNRQTDAGVAESSIQATRDVTIQKLQSDAAVETARIQGDTLDFLATKGTEVQVAQVNAVAKQVGSLMQYSKHFSQDIKAIAPVIALETGQGGAAPGIAAANTQEAIAKSPANTISAVSSGIGKILGGLFK